MTPEGFECWGLVRWVLNNDLGLDLPEDPPHQAYWVRWGHTIDGPFQRHDIVMFSTVIPGLVDHVGVMSSSTELLHVSRQHSSVVQEPIARYRSRIVAVWRKNGL